LRRRKKIVLFRDMISTSKAINVFLGVANIEGNCNSDIIFAFNYISMKLRDNLKMLDYLSLVEMVPLMRSTS
jgi:hypothetical protein